MQRGLTGAVNPDGRARSKSCHIWFSGPSLVDAWRRSWSEPNNVVRIAAVLAPATGVPWMHGCTAHQYDPSSYDYYNGHMIDANTYVTNDWGEPWPKLSPNGTIRMWFPPEVAGRYPKPPIVNIGVDPTPNGGSSFVSGDTYTTAGGQLGEFNFSNTDRQTSDAGTFGGGLWLTNASCASYCARVEVDSTPVEADIKAVGVPPQVIEGEDTENL